MRRFLMIVATAIAVSVILGYFIALWYVSHLKVVPNPMPPFP